MGSWVVDKLVEEGHEVYTIDNLSGGNRENANDEATNYILDLADKKTTEEVVKKVKPEVLFHLAACAREGASQFQPQKVTETNLYAYMNVLEPCIKFSMEKVVLFSCLDEKTHIITTNGIKNFSQIKIGDLVYTLNPKTLQIEIQPIKRIFVYDYSGEMYHFKGKRVDSLVTPNHRVAFIKSPFLRPRLDFENAETIAQRYYFKLPMPLWEGKTPKRDVYILSLKKRKYAKKEPMYMNMHDLFYLIGIYIADGVVEKKVSYRPSSGLSFEERLKIRDEKGRFKKTSEKIALTKCEGYRIRFCVTEDEPEIRKKITDILERNGFKYSFHKVGSDSDKTYIALYSYNLYNIFHKCRTSAKEKYIPSYLLQYDRSYLMKLWEGLMDGDGNKHVSILSTVSPFLVRDCIELGLKLGMTVSFKPYSSVAEIDGRKIKSSGWIVIFGHTEPFMYNKNTYREYYEGKVWCIEVENGNFLVERNGHVLFSGNSMAVYGNQRPPFNETMPRRPADIYGMNKAIMEQATEVLSEVHEFDYVIIRPHNVFGARQSLTDKFRNVVAIFMNRIMRKEPLYIYGDGEQVRAFSYIEDSLPCYIRCLDDDIKNEIINIGGMHPITINHLADLVCEAMGVPKTYPREYLPPRPLEVKEAWCSWEKSVKLLGYEEKIGYEEGIRRMAQWAKEKKGPQEWTEEKLALPSEKMPKIWR